jgi:hypothetical protein
MFYSKTTGGFYDKLIHGEKMIAIYDPAWVRPTVQVPQDDGNGGMVMVEVPDENAEHPTITIPNPDCKIPADAVEITDVEYTELLNAQSIGKRIQADVNGNPVAVDQPKATTAEMWELIKARRDLITKSGGTHVGTAWFHSDSDSRIQQLGLKDEARDMLAAGAQVTDLLVIDGAPVPWKTMSGTFVPMTVQMALDIVAAVKVLDKRAHTVAETHRVAMEASADPSAYDFSADWPVVYTG